MKSGCFVLQLDIWTVKQPEHSTFLSSSSTATELESCQQSTGQITLIPTPWWFYRELESLQSHGQRELCAFFHWVPWDWPPGRSSSDVVTISVGRMLVVASIFGPGWVSPGHQGGREWTTLMWGWKSPRQGGRGCPWHQRVAASIGGSAFDSCIPGQGHKQIMACFCPVPPPPVSKGVLQLYTKILIKG